MCGFRNKWSFLRQSPEPVPKKKAQGDSTAHVVGRCLTSLESLEPSEELQWHCHHHTAAGLARIPHQARGLGGTVARGFPFTFPESVFSLLVDRERVLIGVLVSDAALDGTEIHTCMLQPSPCRMEQLRLLGILPFTQSPVKKQLCVFFTPSAFYGDSDHANSLAQPPLEAYEGPEKRL